MEVSGEQTRRRRPAEARLLAPRACVLRARKWSRDAESDFYPPQQRKETPDPLSASPAPSTHERGCSLPKASHTAHVYRHFIKQKAPPKRRIEPIKREAPRSYADVPRQLQRLLGFAALSVCWRAAPRLGLRCVHIYLRTSGCRQAWLRSRGQITLRPCRRQYSSKAIYIYIYVHKPVVACKADKSEVGGYVKS